MNLESYIAEVGRAARSTSKLLANTDTQQKNAALLSMAESLLNHKAILLEANQRDVEAAINNKLATPLIDRLVLNDRTIEIMAEGLRQVVALPDPIGEISEMAYRPSGIQVGKMRVPLGVIGIIYESRPNVTADAAALCLKSGNAAILRGGSEAFHSNQAIARCIHEGLAAAKLPIEAVQVLNTTDRRAVDQMLNLTSSIDVIIPRGGKGLIQHISQTAKIPVIKHLDGNCHVFIDKSANLEKAFTIALNAKTHRYGTCNTMETLLVHQTIASYVLPRLANSYQSAGVELRGCERTCQQLGHAIIPATEADWAEEYLAPILAIRLVDSLNDAIDHINYWGSHHTDAIVTEDYSRAHYFLRAVDSSSVMINASTRFADGFEYGLGAEIGISTDKMHARGPVGLHGLTSQKWIVLGSGQIRQ